MTCEMLMDSIVGCWEPTGVSGNLGYTGVMYYTGAPVRISETTIGTV
ncbi:MAG: hypothetical protein LBN30_09880 [Oscillospiraceae bacterium]|nr:hypothetical protein [Oscillospiraceae bacterium]